MMRGNHEDVRGRLGIEILEREHPVSALHHGRRDLACSDLTEDAAGHAPRVGESSSKRLPQLLPEFLTRMLLCGRRALDLRELLEERPLLRRQLDRRPDAPPEVTVAAPARPHAR